MSAQALERLLAGLYTDPAALERFLGDPEGEALRAGCSPEEAQRLASPDAEGLRLAHHSFEKKRSLKPPQTWWRRLRDRWS